MNISDLSHLSDVALAEVVGARGINSSPNLEVLASLKHFTPDPFFIASLPAEFFPKPTDDVVIADPVVDTMSESFRSFVPPLRMSW